MPKDKQPDEEDCSPLASKFLRGLDQFVERQSEVRFIGEANQYRTFDILNRRLGSEGKSAGLDTDNEDTRASAEAALELRQRTVEEMWRRLHRLKQRDGYGALYDVRASLAMHREEEEEKLRDANTKCKAAEYYKKILKEKAGEGALSDAMIKAFPPTSLAEELSGPVEPRCHLKWHKDPTLKVRGNGSDAIHSGEIRMRQALDDPDFSFPLKFSPDDTIRDVKASLAKMRANSLEAQQKQQVIFGLITLRKTLLDRFLWTFEVAGGVPKEVTVSHIPEELSDNRQALRYACIILKLRPYLDGATPPISESPSKGDLQDCLWNRIDFGELGCNQPQAVVNGAVRLLKKVLNDRDNEAIDEEFWELLDADQGTLQKAAEEENLDIPVPSGGENASSSDS